MAVRSDLASAHQNESVIEEAEAEWGACSGRAGGSELTMYTHAADDFELERHPTRPGDGFSLDSGGYLPRPARTCEQH